LLSSFLFFVKSYRYYCHYSILYITICFIFFYISIISRTCLNISTHMCSQKRVIFKLRGENEKVALDEHQEKPSTLAEINVNWQLQPFYSFLFYFTASLFFSSSLVFSCNQQHQKSQLFYLQGVSLLLSKFKSLYWIKKLNKKWIKRYYFSKY